MIALRARPRRSRSAGGTERIRVESPPLVTSGWVRLEAAWPTFSTRPVRVSRRSGDRIVHSAVRKASSAWPIPRPLRRSTSWARTIPAWAPCSGPGVDGFLDRSAPPFLTTSRPAAHAAANSSWSRIWCTPGTGTPPPWPVARSRTCPVILEVGGMLIRGHLGEPSQLRPLQGCLAPGNDHCAKSELSIRRPAV